jgi:DNA-binding winged helix-turn-helix (wHTH) protein
MIYRFGDCTLDTQRHRLQRAGQPMRLRAKAFQVLCYLLEHRDRTVLKLELYAQVWPQQFISEATLESTVRTVRQAIGDSGRAQQLIRTVYGYGYRVIAAVEELADLPAEREAKAPGVQPNTVEAPLQDPSAVTPLSPAQGPAAKPDGCAGGGSKDQEGAALLGAPPSPGGVEAGDGPVRRASDKVSWGSPTRC